MLKDFVFCNEISPKRNTTKNQRICKTLSEDLSYFNCVTYIYWIFILIALEFR